MAEIEIRSVEELELGEYTDLQKHAFAEIFQKWNVSMDFLKPSFFEWKYSPPAGKGKIALAVERGKMITCIATFPLNIDYKDVRVTAWQMCDGATLPSERRKGLFRRCYQALLDDLKTDDILFGFPNDNSWPRFSSFGMREHNRLKVSIRPTIPVKASPPIEHDDFYFESEDYESFQDMLWKDAGPHLERGGEYMNWRYLQHPSNDYTILMERDGGGVCGLAIVRKTEILGRSITLIMELFSTSRPVLSRLMRRINRWANGQKTRWIVDSNNICTFMECLKRGFFRIPEFFMHKKIIVVGKGPKVERVLSQKWHNNLGDWDGF